MILHVKVWDDDVGFDDNIGKCDIHLDQLGLSESPTNVERVIDPKKDKWFSKKARMYLDISYIE